MECRFKRKEDKLVCEVCGFWIITQIEEGKLHMECNQKEVKQYPSLFQMAKNFGKAMIEYAKDGFRNVSDEEQERRLSICHSCPLNHYDKEQNRCRACGCNSTLSTRIKSYDCPHGLWKESS